jgi:hypothetical protein
MPAFFRLLSQYFWLVALCFGVINYWRARAAMIASSSSISASAGESYLKYFFLGANLPWVVMGLGQILGYTPTVWYYFRPQDRNPFVISWLAVVFVTMCTFAWWVLFADGAEKVRDFKLMSVLGQRASKPLPLLYVKVFAALGPLIFPVWLYLVVSMNTLLPK